jgi:uncharacterized phage-associated protein
MTPALQLADWVLANTSGPVSALKLQKLLFYTYGAALAHDVEGDIGDLRFQAWKHGPVSVEVYERFKAFGASPLPPPATAPTYDRTAEKHLADAITVYDRLSPWQLRQESHLEGPWVDAFTQGHRDIATDAIKRHFKEKFRTGAVQLPTHLAQAWSPALDRIPVRSYGSLAALADALRPHT